MPKRSKGKDEFQQINMRKTIKLENDLNPHIKVEQEEEIIIIKEKPPQLRESKNSQSHKIDDSVEKDGASVILNADSQISEHKIGRYSKTECPDFIKAVSLYFFNSELKKEIVFESDRWLEMKSKYDNLLECLETLDLKDVKDEHWKDFASKIVELVPAAVDFERPLALKVLRKLYTKFIHLRATIRGHYTSLLRCVIESGEAPEWVPSLLGFVGSILKGFETPLKKEHVLFFYDVLLPLHKALDLPSFHTQLAFCTIECIKKETSLCESTVDLLAAVCSENVPEVQILLLDEIQRASCLLKADTPNCDSVVLTISELIADCLADLESTKVLEKALYFWSNSGPEKLLRDKVRILMPIIFPNLKVLTCHPDRVISGLAYNVIGIFKRSDLQLFMQLRRQE